MYEGFANVYDHVMNNISYEEWFGRLKSYLEDHGIKEGTICELGCGTGIMTEMFAKAGYQMIGVDRSGDLYANVLLSQKTLTRCAMTSKKLVPNMRGHNMGR